MGQTMSGDALLTKVYSEPQRPDEDCAQWATRLEDMCYQAAEKEAIGRKSLAGMVTSRFWGGLRNGDIKNALRANKDMMTIEQLVSQARQLEEEFEQMKEKIKKKPDVHIQQQQDTNEEIRKLMKKMDEVMTTLNQRATPSQQETTQQNNRQRRREPITCRACKEEGHLSYACRQGTAVTCYRCKKVGHIARGCRNTLNC